MKKIENKLSEAKKNEGKKGFNKQYWDENYSEPSEMDGIGNVVSHVNYIKNMFAVEQIRLLSVADLGFGLGYFLAKYIEVLRPERVIGIEPSSYAFVEGTERISDAISKSKRKNNDKLKVNIKLSKNDIYSWSQTYDEKKNGVIDLCICTSVFQYLTDDELIKLIPILALKFRYLYLSVPTNQELKRQVEEVEFSDCYAYHRSKTFYLSILKKDFTFISQRLLESKVFYDDHNTPFTDLLFRF